MARLVRGHRRLFALALLAAPLAVASCGNGAATSDAKAACKRIEVSLKTFERSQTATSAADASRLAAQAQSQLLSSLSFAAQATSADGSFNALMTTVSEANRVPEKYLIPALRRQCQVINSSTPYLAQ